MSTSILYHGFGVKKYRYLRTEYRDGSLIFHIEKIRQEQRCAGCGSRNVIKKGQILRILRTLPIARKKVFLAVHLHRLLCHRCGAWKLEPLLISLPKKRWTKILGRYVLELMRRMTVEDVSRHLGMSWDTVKEIHLGALRARHKRRRIKHLRFLGVDEIAVRKGHRYLTVVVDLDTGRVVWTAEGRKSVSLEPFLRRLKRAGAPVQAIAMDMWPSYIRAVLNTYSSRVLVFDRYHVIADFNRMLDTLRRQEVLQRPAWEKPVYLGVRYLLLRGSEKILEGSSAQAKLDRLLALNQNLYTAYVLKEELRDLWNCESYSEAERCLSNWLQKAWASGIKLIEKFAHKLAAPRTGMLNFFRHRITTGAVEGINNKIKVLKRQAYGFRDLEYFKLRIYSLHESRYALVG